MMACAVEPRGSQADATLALHFPVGMFGFPECRRFRLVDTGCDGLFWLESLEHAPLRFIVADPFRWFEGYSVELSRAEEALLEARDPADVAVLSIVTLPPRPGEAWTANLQAPLALNVRTGTARQVVLNDPAATVRAPFEP